MIEGGTNGEENAMARFVTIGYGDEAGYAGTADEVRDAAHAHDARLAEEAVTMGIAGTPVQVRNHDAAGVRPGRDRSSGRRSGRGVRGHRGRQPGGCRGHRLAHALRGGPGRRRGLAAGRERLTATW